MADSVTGVNTAASVQNRSTGTDKTSSKGSGNLDKDAFLQLLVTQMKYQDPLEPASNTEYMSQLAQFSSLEQMENLNESFDKSDAQSLVGRYVILKNTSDTGKTDYFSGKVDYVSMVNGKPRLSVNGTYYDYSDLDSVISDEYLDKDPKAVDRITGQNDSSRDS